MQRNQISVLFVIAALLTACGSDRSGGATTTSEVAVTPSQPVATTTTQTPVPTTRPAVTTTELAVRDNRHATALDGDYCPRHRPRIIYRDDAGRKHVESFGSLESAFERGQELAVYGLTVWFELPSF